MAFSDQTIAQIGDYHDQLQKFILPLVHHNRDRASDLAQDAMVRALEIGSTLDASPSDVGAFMRDIVLGILKEDKELDKAAQKNLPLAFALAEGKPGNFHSKELNEAEAIQSVNEIFDRIAMMGEKYEDLFSYRYVYSLPDTKIMQFTGMNEEEFAIRVEWLEARMRFLNSPVKEGMQRCEEEFWHELDVKMPVEAQIKRPREIVITEGPYEEPEPQPSKYVM